MFTMSCTVINKKRYGGFADQPLQGHTVSHIPPQIFTLRKAADFRLNGSLVHLLGACFNRPEVASFTRDLKPLQNFRSDRGAADLRPKVKTG